jgi:hypothetical protein
MFERLHAHPRRFGRSGSSSDVERSFISMSIVVYDGGVVTDCGELVPYDAGDELAMYVGGGAEGEETLLAALRRPLGHIMAVDCLSEWKKIQDCEVWSVDMEM